MAEKADRIKFKINGVEYSVGCEVRSDQMLVDTIRNCAELRGTKYMCREAGCGACVVAVSKYPGAPVQSVNSCVVSVLSCNGWEITTIEGIGNVREGYHPVQRTLAESNGSQCGHCSPGWVMAMYSLQQEKENLTMEEIEKSFGSNICRCTGYRPILEAFKKFAEDSQDPATDMKNLQICNKNSICCKDTLGNDWCVVSGYASHSTMKINLKDEKVWYVTNELKDVFRILRDEGTDSYMLVAGNTAKVPYPIADYPRILIDISQIIELKGHKVDQNLIVGGGTTLTELLEIFQTVASTDDFGYLQTLCEHLQLVAHIPVRNIGTIAGNLMIKHQHNQFPSDLYIMFATVGAQITVASSAGSETLSMKNFLTTGMTGKVILNVMLPPLSDEHKLVTFKIMSRAQSVHAVVNAGFLYKLTSDNKVEKASIFFGNLSPTFTQAKATEEYLIGRNLFTNETLQGALKVLNSELKVVESPPNPPAAFRKTLALRLFYKGLLQLCPKSAVHPRYTSGAIRLRDTRPVSSGRQFYDTDKSLWPLTEPIDKIEALIQCSGEAKYTEDMSACLNEVFAAFVLSTVGKGDIESIDPSEALNYPGVIAFYSAKDIPGLNSFVPNDLLVYTAYEEVLSSGHISYYNQPLGILVAESQVIANKATQLVKVTYKNVVAPVINIKEAKKDPSRNTLFTTVQATAQGSDVDAVIKNTEVIYGQYHFPMETLVCVAIPTEEGLAVHSAVQWMAATQRMIARALNVDENMIDMHLRRIGGGFGLKLSRGMLSAVACSLVAWLLNRPCRFIQPLTTNTRAVGKRMPSVTDFEVGVNKNGVIQYCNMETYQDNGYLINENVFAVSIDHINNCYDSSKWSYKAYNTITDNAKNTWCRSPGTFNLISVAELVMEQIAYKLSLDPIEVRLANLDTEKYNDVKGIVETLKTTAEYSQRRVEVDNFNAANRWKKRGLRTTLLRWTPVTLGNFKVIMSVYHGDGTISITHDGVEMGQGINTKAVQVVSQMLGVPVKKIRVKPTNTMVLPNGFQSGSSVTTQNIIVGVVKCCKKLLARLESLRAQLNNPPWEQLIQAAFNAAIDLQTTGSFSANEFEAYEVFGATIAEVEVDVLTGEVEVRRVDLLEDAGRSLNPKLDVGQVEGAFIMGQGLWTCEELVYNHQTGELLTDRPWYYHVPQALDIPADFRIYFREKSMGTENTLGAKCIGEPPLCMSVVIACAIREAISSARFDSGIPTTEWFNIDGPYSIQNIGMATAINIEDLKFY